MSGFYSPAVALCRNLPFHILIEKANLIINIFE